MSPLVDKIRSEIEKSGPIPFARFMESALYCPVYGYYEKEADTVGRRGDFYTSVSVGPLFGELLALEFSTWLELLWTDSGASCFQLVEAGAHNGDLARDILTWLRDHRPGVFGQMEYIIVEPSARRQEWQRKTLRAFADKIRWVPDIEAAGRVRGVIFSNELLDAFPVHRLAWDAAGKAWFEWKVAFFDGRFRWVRDDDIAPGHAGSVLAPQWPGELLATLPHGFVAETCPSARLWWERAARALEWGKLLTIDYGLTADERLSPERTSGTLRGYRRQGVVENILTDPGELDLTAHIDFTELREAGERSGLVTEGFFTQEQFLTQIAGKVFRNEQALGQWTGSRTRQFGTLTHPSHLGHRFRVLVQSRLGQGGAEKSRLSES